MHLLLLKIGVQNNGTEFEITYSLADSSEKILEKQNIFLHHFYSNLNLHKMGNLLYTIAVILVIIWAIGFLGFAAGGIIHLLLVIAVIAVLLRLIQGRKVL